MRRGEAGREEMGGEETRREEERGQERRGSQGKGKGRSPKGNSEKWGGGERNNPEIWTSHPFADLPPARPPTRTRAHTNENENDLLVRVCWHPRSPNLYGYGYGSPLRLSRGHEAEGWTNDTPDVAYQQRAHANV